MGVYGRWAVDEDGLLWRILVPRYLCRRRGPRRGGDRTFSVLPARVVPRRRWALSLGLKVAGWYRDGLSMALDALSDLGLTLERLQVLRIMAVLAIGCERLRQHPLDEVHVETSGGRLAQATACRLSCSPRLTRSTMSVVPALLRSPGSTGGAHDRVGVQSPLDAVLQGDQACGSLRLEAAL